MELRICRQRRLPWFPSSSLGPGLVLQDWISVLGFVFVSESMSGCGSRSILDFVLGPKWSVEFGSESTILLLDMGSRSLVLVLER